MPMNAIAQPVRRAAALDGVRAHSLGGLLLLVLVLIIAPMTGVGARACQLGYKPKADTKNPAPGTRSGVFRVCRTESSMTRNWNKTSDAITKGPARAAARAMLRATGMEDGDFDKPMIGVVNTWTTVTPCNMHLADLAGPVREAVTEAGGHPVDFNTVVVSDGISMGSDGMRASLISRETIADSIELAVRGHCLDGVVILVGCDKTIPAAAMALARMDVPGCILYGGTIMPGRLADKDLSVQDVFEAIGAHAAGTLDDDGLKAVEKAACPAPVPAVASSPPTPWPPSCRSWVSRPWA